MLKILRNTGLLVAILALTFGLTGCTNTTSSSDTVTPPEGEYIYTVSFIKSKDNGTNFEYKTNNKNMEIRTLLTNLNLDNPELGMRFETIFDMNSGENVIDVTKILGVINTAGKKWQLYLDNSKVEYYTAESFVVIPKNKIEWKYEE